MTGLQDWNVAPGQYVPFIDQFDRAGIRVKQMYAQHGHNYPGIVGGSEERQETAKLHRADFAEILLRWLDRELKGLDVDVGAPVQVADDLHRWRNEAHYPPHDTTWTTWHLAPQGFAPEPGETARVPLGIRSIGMEDTCVGNSPFPDLDAHGLFSFPPAEEDVLIVGLPRVHVAITPDTPHTQLFATLCETTADGEARFLSQTTMDLAFADGTRERRMPAPGQTLQALMELQPMDSVVRAGSTLSLQIWINDNSATRRPSWIPSGSATLELGHAIPSVLELPTIVRGPEVYFEPPRLPSASGSMRAAVSCSWPPRTSSTMAASPSPSRRRPPVLLLRRQAREGPSPSRSMARRSCLRSTAPSWSRSRSRG